MNRIDVIHQFIDHCGAKSYLEIGVKKGNVFLNVRARKKLAVDPFLKISAKRKIKFLFKNVSNVFNEYYEMTSDHFFATQFSRLAKLKNVDVAFIDGLHTYQQSLADVRNCLKFLGRKGVILMHDCSPTSDIQARRAESREHAANMDPDGNNIDWSGDVWKTIVNLRSTRSDLHIFVLNCDHGIGVITSGKPENILKISEERIEALSYWDLEKEREKLLNLKSPDYLNEFLTSRALYGFNNRNI